MERNSETKKLKELTEVTEPTKEQDRYWRALSKFNSLVEKKIIVKRQNQLFADVSNILYNA